MKEAKKAVLVVVAVMEEGFEEVQAVDYVEELVFMVEPAVLAASVADERVAPDDRAVELEEMTVVASVLELEVSVMVPS